MAMTGQEEEVRVRLRRMTSTTSITSLLKSLGWEERVGVSLFLEDWEKGGSKLPHGKRLSMPRNEGCVLGELKVAGLTSFAVFTVPVLLSCGIVTARKPFSHHGRAVIFRRGCGESK